MIAHHDVGTIVDVYALAMLALSVGVIAGVLLALRLVGGCRPAAVRR